MTNPEISHFLDSDGKVKTWPAKQGMQELVLAYLAERFETGKEYPAFEINVTLRGLHTFNDHTLLRRELVDRGFMKRTPDGKTYWREAK